MKSVCIFAICMIMLFSTSTSFASSYFSSSLIEPFKGQIFMEIDGRDLVYKYTYSAAKTIVEFNSQGNEYIIIYNRNENKMYLNGKELAFEEELDTIAPNDAVEIGRSYGSLGTDVRDVSVIAGAIIALVGGPGTWAAAIAIAGVIVARGLDRVYYIKITYYDDDTLHLPRPKMWSEYYFYSDPERTDLIGSIK